MKTLYVALFLGALIGCAAPVEADSPKRTTKFTIVDEAGLPGGSSIYRVSYGGDRCYVIVDNTNYRARAVAMDCLGAGQ